MQLRPFIATLLFSVAILSCYGDGIYYGSGGIDGDGPYYSSSEGGGGGGISIGGPLSTNGISIYAAAPIIVPGPFSTDQYTPLLIQFPPTNIIGDPVTYTATATGGTVEVDGLDMTYTPNTNKYFLGGTISFTAWDTVNKAGIPSILTINVIYIPGPPIVTFTLTPLTNFPGVTNPVILCASNGAPAPVVFDDSGTVTRDDQPPYVEWYDGTNRIGGNVGDGWIAEAPGAHTITLWATDYTYTNSLSETFEIITASTAATDLENFIDQSGVPKKEGRPFKRILFKTAHWAAVGRPRRAYIELSDFERKLQSRQNPLDPALTTELETAAQQVMNTLSW